MAQEGLVGALSSFLLLLPSTLAAQAPSETGELALKCNNSDHDACAKLGAIAKTNSDPSVRRDAVAVLSDQVAIAAIAKADQNKDVRYAAVLKLTNQSVLAEIAKTDKDLYVRIAAVEALRNQAVLSEIAKTDMNKDMRSAAVSNIDDQILLTRIAKTDKDLGVRKVAAEKLGGQSGEDLLADIARMATDRDIRKLATIASTDKDPDVRIDAVHNIAAIGEQGLLNGCIVGLEDLFNLKSRDPIQVRCRVFSIGSTRMNLELEEKTTAEVTIILKALGFKPTTSSGSAIAVLELFLVVLPEQGRYWVDVLRYSAASCEGAVSIRVGRGCHSETVIQFASDPPATISESSYTNPLDAPFEKALSGWLSNLLGTLATAMHPSEAQIKEVIARARYATVRKAAAKMIADQAELAKVAETDENSFQRADAASKLLGAHGQAMLARIAKSAAEERHVRAFAIEKLVDQSVLADIVRSDSDSEIRAFAVRRLTDGALLADIAKEEKNSVVRTLAESRLKQVEGR